MKRSALFAACAMCAPLLMAQTATDAPPADPAALAGTVTMSNYRDPELKSYKTMLKGVDTFGQLQALAPEADLRFLLIPNKEAPKQWSLRIANDQASVDVPVREDATFALPRIGALADNDAELLLNARKGSVRWRPDVRTPGVPDGARRLGDLRLECEVRWVVEQDGMSFAQRNLFRMLGGPCGSARVNKLYISAKPLQSATLVQGERRTQLQITRGGHVYVPPIHDKTWDNDARVELAFTAP